MELNIKLGNGSEYQLALELFSDIDPDASKVPKNAIDVVF